MMRVDKVEKRKKILEGALLVFAEKGYHKTKMVDVAHKVGIGKATIYEYFRNKEELFFSLIELLETRLLHFIEDAARSTEDVESRLKRVINSLFEVYIRWENAFRVLLMFWAELLRKGETRPIQEKLKDFYANLMRLIETIYKDGLKKRKFKEVMPPEQFARSVIAMADGLTFQWILSNKSFDLIDSGRKCAEFIVNSVTA